MVLRQALFVQDGSYTAAMDRALIGGLISPGGAGVGPRAGVRPSGRDKSGVEGSLRVTDASTVSGWGTVTVAAGAGFVRARMGAEVNGVYLVVNDGTVTVNLSPEGAPGSTLNVALYLQVLDAEDVLDPEGSSSAEARFLALPLNVQAPPAALLLAECSVPVSGAVQVTDRRVYTSGLGGVLLVRLREELDGLTGVPLGTQVYVVAEGVVYWLTDRGWRALGVVPVGSTAERPATTVAVEGELFYDAVLGRLQVFSKGSWITVGGRAGVVRKQTDPDYSGKRHAMVAVNEFKGKMQANTGWKLVSGLSAVTTLPAANTVEVRFQVFEEGSLAVASISGEVAVKKSDDTTFSTNYGYLALRLLKYTSSATTSACPEYPFDSWGAGAFYYAGMRLQGDKDHFKSRSLLYSLPAGEYVVQPMFMVTGEGGEWLLHVSGLCVEVAL